MGKMSNQLNALSVAEGMRPGTGQLMGSPGIDLIDEVLSRQFQVFLCIFKCTHFATTYRRPKKHRRYT